MYGVVRCENSVVDVGCSVRRPWPCQRTRVASTVFLWRRVQMAHRCPAAQLFTSLLFHIIHNDNCVTFCQIIHHTDTNTRHTAAASMLLFYVNIIYMRRCGCGACAKCKQSTEMRRVKRALRNICRTLREGIENKQYENDATREREKERQPICTICMCFVFIL